MSEFKEFDFDPRNLPDDLLQAIGLTIACGAQTESVISTAIGGCLGLEVEYAAATTTHMTLPLKFSVLINWKLSRRSAKGPRFACRTHLIERHRLKAHVRSFGRRCPSERPKARALLGD
jgi:hypothetical protein